MKRNVDFEAITIRNNGIVCIHRRTLESYELSGMEFVNLGYDPTKRVVTIQPTEEPPSSFAVAKESVGTLAIRCRAFLQVNGIPYEGESKVYPVEWDDKENVLKVKIE